MKCGALSPNLSMKRTSLLLEGIDLGNGERKRPSTFWLPDIPVSHHWACVMSLGARMQSSSQLVMWECRLVWGGKNCNKVAFHLDLKRWLKVFSEGHDPKCLMTRKDMMCGLPRGNAEAESLGISVETWFDAWLWMACCAKIKWVGHSQVGTREPLEVFRQRSDVIRIALYTEGSEWSVNALGVGAGCTVGVRVTGRGWGLGESVLSWTLCWNSSTQKLNSR